VRSREGRQLKFRIKSISATTFKAIQGKAEVNLDVQIFAAFIADIKKALKKKVLMDPQDKLPAYLQSEYRTFLKKEADKLAPYRGPNINYAIKLIEKEGEPATIL
jgi:hypothetical protein